MDALRRSVRLNRLKELLRGRKAGYTPAEMARATGVTVRSIQRDLNVLQWEDGVVLEHRDGRYSLAEEERLGPLALNLQEARALLIATRLFLRYSDELEPHGAAALEKLAGVMPPAVRAQVRAAVEALSKKPFDADFSRNLMTVTEAWSKGRSLRLSYKSAGKARPKEVVVDPYFLEPSAAGFSTYLIGYSRTHEQMRTFKIERIVSAEMLAQHFEIPAGLDVDRLLSSAWGIIWGEGMQVRLRFAPGVAWRVKESRWHPSQEIEELEDGGALLTVSVASLMELGRWVRGWGDAVEVLSPPALREELREEAVRLARTYSRAPNEARQGRKGRAG
ncbi:MAG TPA: WYL domain-containing protein [Dehalococcoidia bacterium]|nr:WYL domain-containing protein [Dehalococcoidia bacterium]